MDSNWEYRRALIHQRMKESGMEGYHISYLPYLDETKWNFIEAAKVGKRLLILYGVTLAAHNQDQKDKVVEWFKEENIWNEVVQSEKNFLLETNSSEEVCAKFTWRVEGAYILAWALNLVKDKPPFDKECNEQMLEEALPILSEPIDGFLENLQLRSQQEIFDENVFNELATTCLRDLWMSRKKNTTKLHPSATHERHFALNWLRQFNQTDDWDENSTDT